MCVCVCVRSSGQAAILSQIVPGLVACVRVVLCGAEALTTIHFLFCRANTGGFFTPVVADVPNLDAGLDADLISPALTKEDALNSWFLCVFISLVTFFKPNS